MGESLHDLGAQVTGGKTRFAVRSPHARELALCDLFCVEAGRRFRTNREALAGREDEVDDRRRAVAAAVREHAGYWVPDAILDEPRTLPDTPLDFGEPPAETAAAEPSEVGAN